MIKYSFDELDNMTTEELERIVDEDAQKSVKEQMDEDTLLYILGLIEIRGSYDETMPDVEDARIEFLKEYLEIDDEKQEKEPVHKKNWGVSILKTACIAVVTTVVLLAATVTAAAAGYDPYKEIVEWTEEVFSLPKGDRYVKVPASSAGEHVAPSLESVQKHLYTYGISGDVVPSYFPEGYSFRDYDGIMGWNMSCRITVSNGKHSIYLQYYLNTYGVDRTYAKDDREPEIYEAGGITHYILTYNGEYKVIWRNGQTECAIYGVDSYEELIKIINSIYE
ncbi:MAG: DUF4367 domain-containing protein [Oscillospiraceae bacterium]|nr:DUF4367 domain-containing protein [Oscillospiraceae bacterium]